MNKSKITFNAISAVFQVAIVGIVYLILYKFILSQIGVKLLGVWSLIIATTSVASIANFGISSSIVKFVSTYNAKKREDLIAKLIFTSLIFIITTYTLISITIYILGTSLLHFFIEEDYINIALTILPFSLISLIINASSGVFNSAIDGIQKNYIKSYIIIFSSIVLLILSILFTPKFGLLGLVYAQIFQSIFVLISTVFFLKKQSNSFINLRWNWDTILFKEIFSYGSKVQAASALEMTFEPVTKFLLSKYGGLNMVGYYEMASRLVVQLRGLIVSANQVIIPVIAESKEINPDDIKTLYKKTFSIVLYVNIILTTCIVIMTPIISLTWIGHYENVFVLFLIICSASTFLNISSGPAYFNYMGEGRLNWIVISILISFMINVFLGNFLGLKFGGIGVVIAFNLSLAIHAILLIGSYHKTKRIKMLSLISHYDTKLILSSIVLVVFSNYIFHSIFNHESTSIQILLYIFSLSLFVFYIIKNETFLVLKTQALKLISTMRH
jgi:O-antigen/teichoic acid export membrane protein